LLFAAARIGLESPRDLRASQARQAEIKQAFSRSPISILCQVLPSVRRTIDDHQTQGETAMAKGEQRSNREAKKPKKEKIKTIAAAPSQKSVGSLQPGVGATKRK
jgi:hypothetical protein